MGFCFDRSYECAYRLHNRRYPKIWAVPAYVHAPFSPKFLTGFCQKSVKNFREKGVWAYPGTAQLFVRIDGLNVGHGPGKNFCQFSTVSGTLKGKFPLF